MGAAADAPPPPDAAGPDEGGPGARFIFATGIECSYPTIGGAGAAPSASTSWRRRSTTTTGARTWRWCPAWGSAHLRYGPPYYRVHAGPDRYDWEFTDEVLAEMRRLGIVPIVDLCHFGVPDWVGDFQNPDWPAHFARFAGAFAERFPWVRFYTPVNEIYVCAKLSALHGPVERAPEGRPRLRHGPQAPLPGQPAGHPGASSGCGPDAIVHPERERRVLPRRGQRPGPRAAGGLENERRFLSFDFLYSVPPVRGDHALSAGQRPDARGAGLVYGPRPGPADRDGQRLLRAQRAAGDAGRAASSRRGRSSAGTSSPASTTSATAAR